MTLDLDVSARIGTLHLRATLATAADRVAITGPSGAGKTTLLRLLAGLEPRARGRVAFRGTVWHEGTAARVPVWERRVGWVPQEALLFPHLDVAANLGYAGRASAAEVGAIAELLEVVPLLSRAPRHLSGGERQRVALGRALLAAPRLLLLDEPFAALDGALRTRLTQRVAAHCRDRDVAFVLVTHTAADAEALAEETWAMHDGLLARAG